MDDATAIVVVGVGSLLLLFVAVDASDDCANYNQASSNGDQGQQATGGGSCWCGGGGWDVGKGFVDGCCCGGWMNSLSVDSSGGWGGGDDRG